MQTANWSDVLRTHREAATLFIDYARTTTERGSRTGHWSFSHVLEHLIKVYEILLDQLQGGEGMKIVTAAPIQWILKKTLLRKILRGNYFPYKAPAPRETRPSKEPADINESLDRFTELATEFERISIETYEKNPIIRLSHSYFGLLKLEEAVLLCARHIEHHHRQLNRR